MCVSFPPVYTKPNLVFLFLSQCLSSFFLSLSPVLCQPLAIQRLSLVPRHAALHSSALQGMFTFQKNSPGVNIKSEELTELSQTLQREKIQMLMSLRSHRLLQADSYVQCMCDNGNFIGLCPVPSYWRKGNFYTFIKMISLFIPVARDTMLACR